jgi:hypothetical protein
MVARFSGDRGRWVNGALGSREGGNGAGEGRPGLAWWKMQRARPASCLHVPVASTPPGRSSSG